MEAKASKSEQKQAQASKSKQKQTKASKSKQMRAKASIGCIALYCIGFVGSSLLDHQVGAIGAGILDLAAAVAALVIGAGSLSMSALDAGHRPLRRFEYKVDFFCFQCQAWWVKKFESHPASWVNFSCSACRPQKSIAQLQVRTPGERSKERVFRHKACGSCPKCLADRAWREECDMRDADIESKVQHEYDDMLQQYSPQKRRRIEHRLHKFLIDERNAERSGGA